MTPQLNVLVCDDDDVRAGRWAARINQANRGIVKAAALDADGFGAAVAALKRRKATAKQEDGRLPDGADGATVFDDADVLIVDSDLTPDRDRSHGAAITENVEQHLVGELGGEVAHLARCYSSVGALMVVNQKWKRRSFDLTMLTFANEVAEVYVSEKDLDNAGLWQPSSQEPGRFRPWAWPPLAHLPTIIDELSREIDLGANVLETLGLSDPEASALTDRQLDALGVEDIATTTFETVADDSNFGLRLKESASDEQRARVAVSAVRRWLDRHVLPSQNVLVDAPHLMQRRPWDVPGRADVDAWNRPTDWFCDPSASTPSWNPVPDAYAGTASRWLGRHVWSTPGIARQPRSPDHRVLPTDPVFCEDTSQFVGAHVAADFTSDLEGQTSQRFVLKMRDVDYHPRRRLMT